MLEPLALCLLESYSICCSVAYAIVTIENHSEGWDTLSGGFGYSPFRRFMDCGRSLLCREPRCQAPRQDIRVSDSDEVLCALRAPVRRFCSSHMQVDFVLVWVYRQSSCANGRNALGGVCVSLQFKSNSTIQISSQITASVQYWLDWLSNVLDK
ncbi:uncharacterized protein EDB91DRAFT_1112010 [Suillus paluster]|uniref:uncharacterized protein n=1 Tax=Suillus paluster TaxID=48578 RepID=UPI001B878AD2|nr:uncharacterized protein EDB91DRAFT_1112010 [Suillus paluster]KAG1749014.1 hypothetical protein EDB91DRAFT_1112010 [Suillus paluster]